MESLPPPEVCKINSTTYNPLKVTRVTEDEAAANRPVLRRPLLSLALNEFHANVIFKIPVIRLGGKWLICLCGEMDYIAPKCLILLLLNIFTPPCSRLFLTLSLPVPSPCLS